MTKQEYNKQYSIKNKDSIGANKKKYYTLNKAKIISYNVQLKQKKSKDADWRKRRIFSEARSRAAKRGIEFNLVFKDIFWPDKCPMLGIRLVYNNNKKGFSDVLPSLDRIEPAKGYTIGNVQVISSRANRIKYNATFQELKSIVNYMEVFR